AACATTCDATGDDAPRGRQLEQRRVMAFPLLGPGGMITNPSRRRFIAVLGSIGAARWMTPRWLLAQDEGIVAFARSQAAKSEITAQPLRGGIAVLIGSGGNIAVLAGPDGKLLVDAGFPASRQKITDALAKISADPIRHLVNTHWHFDHTDGNEWVHEAGA